MTYEERIGDLFTCPDNYYLAQCISADFAMGKGIAVEFNKRYNMKNILKNTYPDYLAQWKADGRKFDCILIDRVFNLITKERYFNKPTYESISGSLDKMKTICLENSVKNLAIPVIGCGLDRLKWDRVSEIIKDIFSDTDIEIIIYKRE